MIRVLFLINSLGRGGAERQLTLLVKAMDRSLFAITVVTVYEGGALRAELESLDGVEVLSLHKQSRADYLVPLWRLARIVKRIQPHLVHGYLDVANELALVFGKLVGAKVVWGLRASNVDFAHYDRIAAWHFRMAARLSGFADLIIANSYAGKSHHVLNGFSGKRMMVIPNGFDTDRFRPDPAAGRHMRTSWGIAEDQTIIGLAARLDPIKDHATFLRAAALLAAERDDVQFVCVGGGSGPYRQELLALGEILGIADRLHWVGEIQDMPEAYNAFDVATLTSTSEGLPNSIGEAMACGVPCVVTDVGDSASLVGTAGLVAPHGDPAALACAWQRLLNLPSGERQGIGLDARERIMGEYNLDMLARRTEAALINVLHSSPRSSPSRTLKKMR